MIIEHVKATELLTTNWTGGTTTQLAIYPKNADYKKQNFQFRISTATVEAEESTFTKLPGVSRKLMILDGEIKIEHKTHYSKTLKKFDQDEFSGDWETKSYGKAIDFNLMTTGDTIGEIEAIILNNLKSINLNTDFNVYGFYIYKGEVKFNIENKSYVAKKGDFVTILPESKEEILKLQAITLSEIIFTKIKI